MTKVSLSPSTAIPQCGTGFVEGHKLENVVIDGPVRHVNSTDCSYLNVEFKQLQNVRFVRCSFTNCTFAGIVEHAEFAACAFNGCKWCMPLTRVTWTQCTGRGITLENAGNISTWRLQHCTLYDVALSSVSVQNLELHHCTITDLRFRWVVLKTAKIERCKLVSASVEECTFVNVMFFSANFCGLPAKPSVFKGSTFRATMWKDSTIPNARFQDTRWFSCDFYDTDLSCGSFENAKLVNVTFKSCNLMNTCWKNGVLEMSTIERGNTIGTDWSHATLLNTTLVNVDEQHVCVVDTTFQNVKRRSETTCKCEAEFNSVAPSFECRFIPYCRQTQIPLQSNRSVFVAAGKTRVFFQIATTLSEDIDFIEVRSRHTSFVANWFAFSQRPPPSCTQISIGTRIFLPYTEWLCGAHVRGFRRVESRGRSHSI